MEGPGRMLNEITDVREIASAQHALERQLNSELRYKRTRKIGYPSGHFTTDVRFEASSGNDVMWWSGGVSDSGENFFNFIGRGDPQSGAMLTIDLQVNLPARRFSRTHGGAFVRDNDTGEIFVAHRGIVTRGNSRVPKKVLLQEVDVTSRTVTSDVTPYSIDLLIAAPVDTNNLSHELREFALEIRRAANVFGERGSATRHGNRSNSAAASWQKILGDYFEEFSGSRTVVRSGTTTFNWRHGKVVGSLRKALAGRGQCYKSNLLDLALDMGDRISIFEVKTNASTQSVYTGLGQLFAHGALVKKEFPEKKMTRCLVMPARSLSRIHTDTCRALSIEVVTFEERGADFRFSGL